MENYRYKTAEIEAMKKDILTHCESETTPDRNGNKSAWRLRLILEGMAMCCRCSKREEARRYRKLALFERLTANDMPNWLTEPTQPAMPAETPQISTETAEATNVSTEGEKKHGTAKYRFTLNEIEEMKQQILGTCEFNATALDKGHKKVFPEMGEYSALNIRRCFKGYINEFKEGSKNRKFYERELALYESLTENDRPNFIHTQPEPVGDSEQLAAIRYAL